MFMLFRLLLVLWVVVLVMSMPRNRGTAKKIKQSGFSIEPNMKRPSTVKERVRMEYGNDGEEEPDQRKRRRGSSGSSALNLSEDFEDIRDTVNDQGHRMAVAVYYIDVLHAPSPKEWDGKQGTVSIIRRELKFPEGSEGVIRAVLVDVHAALQANETYTGEPKYTQGGANKHIQLGSLEEQIAADCIEGGFGYRQATYLVNEYRERLEPPKVAVGRTAVYSAVQRLNPKVTAVLIAKQGSYDVASPWAIARLRFSCQLLVRLGLMTPLDAWVKADHVPLILQNPANIPSYFKVANIGGSLHVNQIAFWDETHKKPVIGGVGHEAAGSRKQTRFRRDVNGKLDVNGGYGDRQALLKVKYSAQETCIA